MAVLNFQDLEFVEEKERDRVRAYFLGIYYFYLAKDDLKKIADFKISGHSIEFDCSEKKASNKFNHLLLKGFDGMVCSLNNVRTVYVHRHSGIPVVGAGVFGLVDRNTSCIEVKPLTACNLDCVYCSVNAGFSSRKQADYVVEKDYLVQEFNKLAENKQHGVEAHIGPRGEPLLYTPLVELVRELSRNPRVKYVSLDTNGVLLTKKLIDDLASAGLARLNISINSLDEKKCREMAGTHFNLKHLLNMIDYASKKTSVLLAPVLVPGMNDDELESLVRLAKKIKSGGLDKSNNDKSDDSGFPVIGVQNFLNYKHGRNPVKQRSWEEFFKMLEPLEKKHRVKLRLSSQDFGTVQDAGLKKPFKKKQVVKARIVCPGPHYREMIGAAGNRAIIISKAADVRVNSFARLRIVRDKHNIFRGVKL